MDSFLMLFVPGSAGPPAQPVPQNPRWHLHAPRDKRQNHTWNT